MNKPLYGFLLSCLLAFIAGHMVNYSIIFLALEWFDSHALAGLGYGLCFGPPIVLGWLAGVYCDRYSPRKVILIAQNSYLVSLALLLLALSLESSRLPLLLIAAFFSGVGWSFVAPARFATLPFYVNSHASSLNTQNTPEQSQALTGATIALNVMVMSGFGLAPLLVKQLQSNFDWSAVFYAAIALFVLSTLLLLPLKFAFKGNPKGNIRQQLNESFKVVKQSSTLRALLWLAIITYLLMGPMQVILPTIAEQQLHLSPTAQGNYLSLVAFSLIIGGLLAMTLKSKLHAGRTMILTIIIAGAGLSWLAIEQRLAVSVLTLIGAALSGGIAISFIVAGLQANAPEAFRGRIMSIYSIISQVIPAVSGVLTGVVAQWFTPLQALVSIGAVIVTLALLAVFLLPNIRQLEALHHAAPTNR